MSEGLADWMGRPVWDGQLEHQLLADARADEAERARDEAEEDPDEHRRQA